MFLNVFLMFLNVFLMFLIHTVKIEQRGSFKRNENVAE